MPDTSSERVLIDVGSDDYTLGQIMQMLTRYQDEHPELEVYLDGDRRMIMGRAARYTDSTER